MIMSSRRRISAAFELRGTESEGVTIVGRLACDDEAESLGLERKGVGERISEDVPG